MSLAPKDSAHVPRISQVGRTISLSLFVVGALWSVHSIFVPIVNALFLEAPASLSSLHTWCENQVLLLRSDLKEGMSIEVVHERPEQARTAAWKQRLNKAQAHCPAQTPTLQSLSTFQLRYDKARNDIQNITSSPL